MKIIFSPTKTMTRHPEYPYEKKEYSEITKKLILKLKSLTEEELKKLFKISDTLLKEVIDDIKNLSSGQLTPAIYSYEGIQYQYLDVKSLDEQSLKYLLQNMYIVSGLFGLLKPLDGIEPYRLDLNDRLQINDKKNLYDLWGDSLYQELYKNHEPVINLCSEEYSKVIRKHLKDNDVFLDVVFYEEENGFFKEKGVYCKMARGLFCRYLATKNIQDIEGLKQFNEQGYHYMEALSSPTKLVFAR